VRSSVGGSSTRLGAAIFPAGSLASTLPAKEGHRTRNLKALAGFSSSAMEAARADQEAAQTSESTASLARLGLSASHRLTNRQRANLQPELVGMSNGARALDQATFLTSSTFSKSLPPHLLLRGAAKYTHRRMKMSRSETAARAQARQMMSQVLQFGGTSRPGKQSGLGGGATPAPLPELQNLEWNADAVQRNKRIDAEAKDARRQARRARRMQRLSQQSLPAEPSLQDPEAPHGETPVHGSESAPVLPPLAGSTGEQWAREAEEDASSDDEAAAAEAEKLAPAWIRTRPPADVARALRAAQSLPQLIATKTMRGVPGRAPSQAAGAGSGGYGKHAGVLGGRYGQKWHQPRRRRRRRGGRSNRRAALDAEGLPGESKTDRDETNLAEEKEEEALRAALAREDQDLWERTRITSAEADPDIDPALLFSREAAAVLPASSQLAQQRAAARQQAGQGPAAAVEGARPAEEAEARARERRRAQLRVSARQPQELRADAAAADTVVLGSGQPYSGTRHGNSLGTMMVSVSKQGARAQMQGVRAATDQLQQRLAMAAEVAKASEQRRAVNEARGFDQIAVSRAAASEAFWARQWGLSSELIGHSNQLQPSMAKRRERDAVARAKSLTAQQQAREMAAERRRGVALDARKARAKEFFDSRKGAGQMAELREQAQMIREAQASLAAQEMAEAKLGRGGEAAGRTSYSVVQQSKGASEAVLSSAALASPGVGAAMGVVHKAGRLNSVGTRRAADAMTGGGGVLAHGPQALQEDAKEGTGYGTAAQDQLERAQTHEPTGGDAALSGSKASPGSFDAGVSMGGYQYAGALDPYRSEPRAVRPRSRTTSSHASEAAHGQAAAQGRPSTGSHEEEYLLGLARRRFAHSGGRLAAPDTAFSRPDNPDPGSTAAAELEQAVGEAEGRREQRRAMSQKLMSRESSRPALDSLPAELSAQSRADDASVGMRSSVSSLLEGSKVLALATE
jgi:hypothetical protein